MTSASGRATRAAQAPRVRGGSTLRSSSARRARATSPRSRSRRIRPARRPGVQFSPSGKMTKTSLGFIDDAIRVTPASRSSPEPEVDGTKKDCSRVRIVSMPGSQRSASASTMRGSRPAVRESSHAMASESAGPACRASAMSGWSALPKCIRSASSHLEPDPPPGVVHQRVQRLREQPLVVLAPGRRGVVGALRPQRPAAHEHPDVDPHEHHGQARGTEQPGPPVDDDHERAGHDHGNHQPGDDDADEGPQHVQHPAHEQRRRGDAAGAHGRQRMPGRPATTARGQRASSPSR